VKGKGFTGRGKSRGEGKIRPLSEIRDLTQGLKPIVFLTFTAQSCPDTKDEFFRSL